jgi:hypothetical protein
VRQVRPQFHYEVAIVGVSLRRETRNKNAGNALRGEAVANRPCSRAPAGSEIERSISPFDAVIGGIPLAGL